MEQEKNFIKNTAIVSAGKILTQVINFLLLPLYTYKLNPANYGIVDLYQTYASIIIVFIFLQTEQALFRQLVEKRTDEEGKKEIISTTLLWNLLVDLLLIFAGIFLFQLFKEKHLHYICFMVAAIHFMEDMLQLARGEGDNLSYSIANFINSISIILLNIFFIAIIEINARGMFLSIIFSNIIGGLYIFTVKRIYRRIKLKYFKWSVLKSSLEYSIPLVFNSISWWLISASDRIIISAMIGISAVGIITVSQKFSTMLFNIYCVINITWNEYISLNIHDIEKTRFSEVLDIVIYSFLCLCVSIIAVMPLIFGSFIDHQYSDSYYYIPIYIGSTFFNICINLINAFYVGYKKTGELAKTSFFSGVLNIVINVALVKKLGIYAAAFSTFISFFITAVWRINDIKKYLTIRWNKNKIFIFMMIFLIAVIIYYWGNNIFLNLLILLLISAAWLLSYKKYISLIWVIIKRRLNK